MPDPKKIYVLALLCAISNPSWSREVNFCKVVRVIDENNVSAPPTINYQDCSGITFLDYGKYFVEASCWPGSVDLLEGKCEKYGDKDLDQNQNADQVSEDEIQKDSIADSFK
ncbi:hypothetical protein [Methylomonas sp. MgM2]